MESAKLHISFQFISLLDDVEKDSVIIEELNRKGIEKARIVFGYMFFRSKFKNYHYLDIFKNFVD